jgi:hypothetical protein
MNKVIAEITTEQNSVVHGDHQIITAVAIKEGVNPFDAGTLLFEGESGYEPLAASDVDNKPTAVAYDNLEEKASNAVVNVVIHGAVRGEKLLYADKTPATEDVRKDLRDVGIYAIGKMAESSSAEG